MFTNFYRAFGQAFRSFYNPFAVFDFQSFIFYLCKVKKDRFLQYLPLQAVIFAPKKPKICIKSRFLQIFAPQVAARVAFASEFVGFSLDKNSVSVIK